MRVWFRTTVSTKRDSFPCKQAMTFGGAHRICAGMFLAENSLWVLIARILSTMKISHAYDGQGRKIDVELKPSTGVVSCVFIVFRVLKSSLINAVPFVRTVSPSPFRCSIVPRSEQAMRLIAAKEED